MTIDPRYPINHPDDILSPSLLIFRDIVRENLRSMIAMVALVSVKSVSANAIPIAPVPMMR